MKLLENAKRLYIEGIEQGDYENAIDKYSGENYVQHSTGVSTGQEGFKSFFANFTERHPNRKMTIVHSFEENNLAFLFVIQNLDGVDMWVTMDIFAGDSNNQLIEHWDVIEQFEQPITHSFNIVENNIDLKQLVQKNLSNFKLFISNKAKKNYDYNNHKCYQILQADNYVAMLSGFDHKDKPYAQISLMQFDKDKLIGYWSTTEVIDNSNSVNIGKF